MPTGRPTLLILITLGLLGSAGCACGECEGEPPAVDRSGRPAPTIPEGDRSELESRKAAPGWALREDKNGQQSRLSDMEGHLSRLFGAGLTTPDEGIRDGLLACYVALKDTAKDSNAEGLIPFSEPDLASRLTFGQHPEIARRGGEDRRDMRLTIPFISLKKGQKLRVKIADRDGASNDDLIDDLRANFEGLPMMLDGEAATVECRAVPDAVRDERVEILYDVFTQAHAYAAAVQRDPAAIEEGYPDIQVNEMKGALRLIAEIAGWQHPYAVEGVQKFDDALQHLEATFPGKREAP